MGWFILLAMLHVAVFLMYYYDITKRYDFAQCVIVSDSAVRRALCFIMLIGTVLIDIAGMLYVVSTMSVVTPM